MPFNEHQRSDSWPPTVLHLRAADGSKDSVSGSVPLGLRNASDNAAQDEPEDFEDNPFSYFLSSPDDSDDEDLSAGIETPDSESVTPIIRTVSPSDFQRVKSEEIISPVSSEEDYIYEAETFSGRDEFGLGITVPLTLREFSDSYQESEFRPRLGRSQSLSLFPPVRETKKPISNLSSQIKNHIRGRSSSLHLPAPSRRLRSDSYPVRRPHSWRRPSDDVFTIPEESSSASNSSKESLGSENKNETKAQRSPNSTLSAPSTRFEPGVSFQESHRDTLSSPLKLKGTLEGEDPTQISVWGRKVGSTSSAPKSQEMFSALGSPTMSPTSPQESSEEDERSLALARVTVLEEAPLPPPPVVRLPLRRKKTVRFALPELQE